MWTKVPILLQKEVHLFVTGPHHLPKGRLGTSGNDWFQKYFCLYLLTYYFIKYFLRGTSKALKMFRKCIKIKQTNLSGWVFTFLFDFDCCISSLGTLSNLHFPFIQLVTLINQTKHRYRLIDIFSNFFRIFLYPNSFSNLNFNWSTRNLQ